MDTSRLLGRALICRVALNMPTYVEREYDHVKYLFFSLASILVHHHV